ncbi:hypothetical protein CEUSTIGMA_g6291.t1 [Chlamydomonas eustigma]|uniref:Uncharacterized protein n=1 Tax=Chlamydomonas eustigma TaxID=1157962 RepID=A0A250X6Y9_9CHLO|nr:hypothetical protein CEUSTIGMA_g6291.t1 [Chlamydomonas eustigma]|eukprot:GAX78853.1 hypothetical protein CEUSTIGMA_g6291.t1 [Chlamydomonas eustigma]
MATTMINNLTCGGPGAVEALVVAARTGPFHMSRLAMGDMANLVARSPLSQAAALEHGAVPVSAGLLTNVVQQEALADVRDSFEVLIAAAAAAAE